MADANINSLTKDDEALIDYFKDILQNKWLDILCISEVKLDDSLVEKDLNCDLVSTMLVILAQMIILIHHKKTTYLIV